MRARSRYEGVRIVLSGVLTATMVLVALPQSSAQSRQPGPSPAAVAHRQFFDRYCVSCHNERLKSGDLNLASADPTQPGAMPQFWEKVVAQAAYRRDASSRRPAASRCRPPGNTDLARNFA